jgi:peptidoglycan/LPS O-acetylase OafA/YrhL
LPNVEISTLGVVLGISQFWTIGVEEQFYLIWPVLMKKFRKHLPACFLAVIALKALAYRLWLWETHHSLPPSLDFLGNINSFMQYYFPIESMAVGGIGAYIVFTNRQQVLKVIFHPVVEKLILVLVVYTGIKFRDTPLFPAVMLQSIIYLSLILNVACNPRSTLKLENKFWHRLGSYSYGIYVYHTAIIYLVLMAFSFLHFTSALELRYNLILYGVVIGLTILVAAVSYEKYEKRFLRLKSKVQVVRSGDDARDSAPISLGEGAHAAIIAQASTIE